MARHSPFVTIVAIVPGLAIVGFGVAASLSSTHDTWDSKIDRILVTSTHGKVPMVNGIPLVGLRVGEPDFRAATAPSSTVPPFRVRLPQQIPGFDPSVRFVSVGGVRPLTRTYGMLPHAKATRGPSPTVQTQVKPPPWKLPPLPPNVDRR